MARPNMVPGVPQKSAALLSGHFDPNRDIMFNPAAFGLPAPFTFGNSPRTFGGLRRFAYLNEDILHHQKHECERTGEYRVPSGLPEYF